jgi:hypothetical protein
MLNLARPDELYNTFQPDLIGFAEIVKLITVDIQNAEHFAADIEQRHDYF